MSLQICPNCLRSNAYWRIYRELNFKHFRYGMKIKCEKCGSKMLLKQKYSTRERIIGGILWMTPALILIGLVATQRLNFLVAILLITTFHFSAFYAIIKYMSYSSVEKK